MRGEFREFINQPSYLYAEFDVLSLILFLSFLARYISFFLSLLMSFALPHFLFYHLPLLSRMAQNIYIYILRLHAGTTCRWFRGRMVCALDNEAGDPGSIPGSGGTTDWLFSAGW